MTFEGFSEFCTKITVLDIFFEVNNMIPVSRDIHRIHVIDPLIVS